MPRTNKERLQDNNLELQNIKTGIDNLPEYQDIEPVYIDTDFALLQLPRPNMSMAVTIKNSIDNYVLYKCNNIYYIAEFINGEFQIICSNFLTDKINSPYTYIIDYDEDYIYIEIGATGIYKVSREDSSTTTIRTMSTDIYVEPYYRGCAKLNKIVGSYVGYFDRTTGNFTTKEISFHHTHLGPYTQHSDSSGGYSRIIYFDTENKNYTIINYSPSEYSFGIVRGVTFDYKYIFLNNSIYTLNNDLSLGVKIKDYSFSSILPTPASTSERSSADFSLHNLSDDFFYSSQTNTIYRFDRDNIDFIPVLTISKSATISGNYLQVEDTIGLGAGEPVQIGYKYNGQFWYTSGYDLVTSNDILAGKNAYTQHGIKTEGVMPNNGELNYTPSTEEQTIPAGYTSGGTIAAYPVTEEEYNTCLGLTNQIIGNGGN